MQDTILLGVLVTVISGVGHGNQPLAAEVDAAVPV
jgi:hypothetical protein